MRLTTPVLLAVGLSSTLAAAEPVNTEPEMRPQTHRNAVIEHIRSELPADKTVAERTRSLSMFESLDSNRDETVSFAELRRYPTLVSRFHRLDTNNDGMLNREEIQPLQDELTGLRSILLLTSLRII